MGIAKGCTIDSRGASATMTVVRLLLLFVAFAPAQALAQNATTTGTLDLKAAMQGIAYQATYTGDANTNNTATVQYRKTGSGTWLNAYIVINGTLINPFNDRRATISGVSNPYYRQFRGSIVGLQPGTSYDVQVTYSDPDGVSGGPTLTGTISTVTTTPPHAGSTITVTNDTSFNSALTTVTAGQTIHVNAGSYTGTKTLTVSGTSSNYIVVDCDNAGGAHISGGSPTIQINANYVVVQYCDLPSSATTGIAIGSGHHDIYIQNNTLDAVNSGCNEGSGIDLRFASSNIWILNNTIHQGAGDCSPNQLDGADTNSGQGINIEDGGSGSAPGLTSVTIKGNTITGVFDDAITQNSAAASPHIENIEVISNTIQDYKDDGIEFKVMSINNRAIGNTVIANNAVTCFAANSNLTNGQSYGPVYFARNNCHFSQSANNIGAIWKIGNSNTNNESTPLFIIHNSVYENSAFTDIDHLHCENSGQTMWYINNIYYGRSNYIANCAPQDVPGSGLSVWDHNHVYTCCNRMGYNLHNFPNSNPSSFSDWQAEGSNKDPHSINSSTLPFVSATNLHLVAGSPVIDKGVVLYNFNDANSAWPYSGAAPDIGAFELSTSTAGTPFTISDRGAVSLVTPGAASTIQQGYALVQPDLGRTAPAGLAIFGFRQNGILVTETSVAASPLIQKGRMYAEVNGPVNTGVAIANPDGPDANLSFYFTDSNGNSGNSGSTVLAKGQIAVFVNQAPFNSQSSFTGSFTFTSSIPVSVIALRGLINERNEFLMTTLSVANLSVPSSTSTLVFPLFADGGGSTTQILLVNPTDSVLTGTVQFSDSLGKPAVVTVNGQASDSFSYSIPGRSSQKLQTTGTGPFATTGSVNVVPTTNNAVPSGLAIFSFKSAGITVSEAGIPPVPPATSFRLYVEASGDFSDEAPGSIQTGIAVSNTSSTTATVTLELFKLDGSSTGLTGTIVVPGSGHAAMFLNQILGLASLQTPFQGVLRVSSPASISVAGLRSRYNERQDFLFTTAPSVNEASVESTPPLYFPAVADGGGYTTQFILFSGQSGQFSSGSLQLFTQSGTPLNLTCSTTLRLAVDQMTTYKLDQASE